ATGMPARLQTRMRPAERRRPRRGAATVFVGLSYSLSHLRGSADEQSLEHFPIRLRHSLRRHARAYMRRPLSRTFWTPSKKVLEPGGCGNSAALMTRQTLAT